MFADISKAVFSEDEFHIIKPQYIWGNTWGVYTKVVHTCPIKDSSFFEYFKAVIRQKPADPNYEEVIPFDKTTVDFERCSKCHKGVPDSVKTLFKMESSFDPIPTVQQTGNFYYGPGSVIQYNPKEKVRESIGPL